MPKSEDQCRAKLKELFLKNKDVTDVRVIDMLVIKVTNSINIYNFPPNKRRIILFIVVLCADSGT